jgi:hypothetical protein
VVSEDFWSIVKVKTSITLPDDLLEEIDRAGSNRSSFLEKVARQYLAQIEKPGVRHRILRSWKPTPNGLTKKPSMSWSIRTCLKRCGAAEPRKSGGGYYVADAFLPRLRAGLLPPRQPQHAGELGHR